MPQSPSAIDQAPVWNLVSEYPALDSSELQADLATIRQHTDTLKHQTDVFIPALEQSLLPDEEKPLIAKAWELLPVEKETSLLLANVFGYAFMTWSTDSSNSASKELMGLVKRLESNFSQAVQPLHQFLVRLDEELFTYFLSNPAARDSAFLLSYERRTRSHLLSISQENLITALQLDGHRAWGNLYDNLTSSLSYDLPLPDGTTQTMGFAQLLSLLGGNDGDMRERAYHAIHALMQTHQESFAAILNALAGWRLEVGQQRSQIAPYHFLDHPLHLNRLERNTLDTMIDSAHANRALGQRAYQLQARLLGKDRLDPWDVNASPPPLGEGDQTLSFEEAMDIVVAAFNEVDPEMGAFARMMQDNGWIDARPASHKMGGAYCSGFPKSNTPRVFMTFMGSTVDLITLAHELGHAFHSWVMRDLSFKETQYPMTLAETASTFAETVVRNYLLERATTPEQKAMILWQEVGSIPRFLINIPVRYSFEKALYEGRAERSFAPADLCALMSEHWNAWHGDSVSGADDFFWASKMHFAIVEISFYNFPYTFGYLFSQGIYAQRQRLGEGFFPFYRQLLRDTGTMTVEALVQKHLGLDLREPAFWQQSLQVVEGYVSAFEELVPALSQ